MRSWFAAMAGTRRAGRAAAFSSSAPGGVLATLPESEEKAGSPKVAEVVGAFAFAAPARPQRSVQRGGADRARRGEQGRRLAPPAPGSTPSRPSVSERLPAGRLLARGTLQGGIERQGGARARWTERTVADRAAAERGDPDRGLAARRSSRAMPTTPAAAGQRCPFRRGSRRPPPRSRALGPAGRDGLCAHPSRHRVRCTGRCEDRVCR